MTHDPHPSHIKPYATGFGDLQTVDRTNVIDISSSFPLSQQVNDTDATTSNASVTQSNGEITLSTPATASETADLRTSRRGRYTPGYVSVVGIGVRDPAAPTGAQEKRWGYFDANDGVYFGRDSTGLYVERLSGGTRQGVVRQADWNVDTLDGSGGSKNPSGINLDVSEGHVYRIPHNLYGYGEFRFQVLLPGESGLFPVTVHRMDPTGEVALSDWNLPVRALVENNGEASAADLHVGGRQYSLRGRYTNQSRIKSERILQASLSGTTWLPLISFRKKSARVGTPVDFLSFEVISSDNLVIQVKSDATLSDANFGTPTGVDANETAVETDILTSGATDTSITIGDGFQRWQGFHVGGQGGQQRASTAGNIETSAKDTDIVSVAVRLESGTGGSASLVARWSEQW